MKLLQNFFFLNIMRSVARIQSTRFGILIGLLLLFVTSIAINVMLLSSYLHSTDEINRKPKQKGTRPCHQSSSPSDQSPAETLNTDSVNNNPSKNNNNPSIPNKDLCHLNTSMEHKLYVYDLPWWMREEPRMRWYEMFNQQSHANYNDTKAFNFGFGDPIDSSKGDGFHSTHMHSLEIILNERFKKADYYLTDNPDEALIFHIPFPFAQHFRYYHRSDKNHILGPHEKLQQLLLESDAYNRYFSNKPHFLLYGRIAYETGRLERAGSRFWTFKDGDVTTYWHVSIDRNCHGDPPSCWKRISMPHPSNFHPTNVHTLKKRIDSIKASWDRKRDILLSFCGAVRTPLRENAMKACDKTKRNKWSGDQGYWHKKELCRFEDSEAFEQSLKDKGSTNQSGRKRAVEVKFGTECIDLYDRSVFCLQDGADSTTRKALWDGIVAGCIPVFLSGVMAAEFDCFGGNLDPWYLTLEHDYYIKQLMALPEEFVLLLRRNLLRMIPRILYTNGEAGFADAFDVMLHCLMRKTSFENQIDNPGCTVDELVRQRDKLYDFDAMLGYDKLYEYLEI